MTRPPPAPLSGQQLLQECTYKESRSILVFLTAALTDSSLPARRIPRRASVAVSLSRLQRGTSVRVLDGRGGFHVRHPVRRVSGQEPHGVELVQCHAESEHLVNQGVGMVGFRVLGYGFWGWGFKRVQGKVFRIQGSGCIRVQGAGCRFQGVGFRI
jgi:hypothetical protein